MRSDYNSDSSDTAFIKKYESVYNYLTSEIVKPNGQDQVRVRRQRNSFFGFISIAFQVRKGW